MQNKYRYRLFNVLLIIILSVFFIFKTTNAADLKRVALEQTGDYLFLADYDSGKILIFKNDNYGKLVKAITVGNGPSDMAVYGDNLFVALSQTRKIKVIKISTLEEVGDIDTLKMPYWLAIDGNNMFVAASIGNGSGFEPFLIGINPGNITQSASSEIKWPNGYIYFSGNDQIIINPNNHTLYNGNRGYSPDNISKWDISNISDIKYLMSSEHGALGSNGRQFIFDESYSKIYFAASGVSGYTAQIVNPSNLKKDTDLPLGAYPNAIGVNGSYIYAGKDAVYDNDDVKVFDRKTNIFVRSYSFANAETLLAGGLSVGKNVYAVTNKYLYILDSSVNGTKIYDFINNVSAVNENASISNQPSSNNSSSQTTTQNTSQPSLAGSDIYKAIVKIKSYVQNDDMLSGFGSGSGVIINSSGLVLTNYHVVAARNNFNNSEHKIGLQICLPKSSTDEPDCSYLGRIVFKNKDLDLALVQIESIPGLSTLSSYPYLEVVDSDTTSINDEVNAIGYPGIGGDTVTITRGIISGKLDKYNKKWIKTDAVVSFGNSGGAAINKDGKVIGITSASHSDLAGSLGYIISAATVNPWVSENKNKKPESLNYKDKLMSFSKVNKSLNNSNTFKFGYPALSIVRPDNWTFYHSSENELYITNMGDDDGGYISLSISKNPYFFDGNNISNKLKMDFNRLGISALATISKVGDVKIGGLAAKEVTVSMGTKKITSTYLIFREYLIEISTNYGVNERDKDTIKRIVSSINIDQKKVKPFSEIRQYSSVNPKFSLRVSGDWVLGRSSFSNEQPLSAYHKKHKNILVSVHVKKTDEQTKNYKNDDYVKYQKQQDVETNQMLVKVDSRIEGAKYTAHVKLNSSISDAIREEYVEKKISTNEVLAYDREYVFKSGDKWVTVNMTYYGNNKNEFAKYSAEFDKMLQGLSLGEIKNIDSDNDGLSDEMEAQYGTNINNPDTDSDGYKDGQEVRTKHNPNGI